MRSGVDWAVVAEDKDGFCACLIVVGGVVSVWDRVCLVVRVDGAVDTALAAEGFRWWRDLGAGYRVLSVGAVVVAAAAGAVVEEEVCDGGRRIVAPVRVVADDLVREWPFAAAAGRAVAEDGRPDDVVGRDKVVDGVPDAEVGRVAVGLFLVVIGGRLVAVEATEALPCGCCRVEGPIRPKIPEVGLLLGTAPVGLLPPLPLPLPAPVVLVACDAILDDPFTGSRLGEVVLTLS